MVRKALINGLEDRLPETSYCWNRHRFLTIALVSAATDLVNGVVQSSRTSFVVH